MLDKTIKEAYLIDIAIHNYHLEDTRVDGRILDGMNIRELGWGQGLDRSGLG